MKKLQKKQHYFITSKSFCADYSKATPLTSNQNSFLLLNNKYNSNLNLSHFKSQIELQLFLSINYLNNEALQNIIAKPVISRFQILMTIAFTGSNQYLIRYSIKS